MISIYWFLVVLGKHWSIAKDDMTSEQCSIFDFEQKLLEKLVRLEVKFETCESKVDHLEKKLETTQKQLDDLKKKRLEDQNKGYAGGSHQNNEGAAAEPVCLPADPDFNKTSGNDYGRMFGAEINSNLFAQNSNFQDVPCAVCRVKRATSIIMIPAKTCCPTDWKLEYYGYLASGHHVHKAASTYICVDVDPEYVHGGSAWNGRGKLFYEVIAKCGSLKCPPYREGYPLTCVVCSK